MQNVSAMHSHGLLVGFSSASEIAMTVRFTETFCSCLKLSLLILATPRPQSKYSTSPEKKARYFRHTQLMLLQQHPSATTKLGVTTLHKGTLPIPLLHQTAQRISLGALWLFSLLQLWDQDISGWKDSRWMQGDGGRGAKREATAN